MTEAFVFDESHGRRRLSDLLAPADRWFNLEYATHINNRGQILGIGQKTASYWSRQLFLMTPMAEPSSASLALCCAIIASRFRQHGRRLYASNAKSD